MLRDYNKTLFYFRLKAQNDFAENLPGFEEIESSIDSYIERVVNRYEGDKIPKTEYSSYASGLIASFVRTFYIVKEHIHYAELIEAVTLLRKQLEALSRLNELLKVESIERILKKTPNVKNLSTSILRMYGTFSEVAHSSVSIHFELLGISEKGNNSGYSLFPHYSENVNVAYQHLIFTFLEFFLWMKTFQDLNVPDYTEEEDLEFLDSFLALCLEKNIFEMAK